MELWIVFGIVEHSKDFYKFFFIHFMFLLILSLVRTLCYLTERGGNVFPFNFPLNLDEIKWIPYTDEGSQWLATDLHGSQQYEGIPTLNYISSSKYDGWCIHLCNLIIRIRITITNRTVWKRENFIINVPTKWIGNATLFFYSYSCLVYFCQWIRT